MNFDDILNEYKTHQSEALDEGDKLIFERVQKQLKKQKRRRRFLVLLVSISVLLSSAFFVYQSVQKNAASFEVNKCDGETPDENSIHNNAQASLIPNSELMLKAKNNGNTEVENRSKMNLNNNLDKKQFTFTPFDEETINSNNQRSPNQNQSEFDRQKKSQFHEDHSKNAVFLQYQNGPQSFSIDKSEETFRGESLSSIPHKISQLFRLGTRDFPFLASNDVTISTKPARKKWSAQIFAGTTLQGLNYSVTDKIQDYLDDNASSQLGFTAGAYVRHHLDNNWILGTGLSYQNYWSRMKLQQSIRDQVLLEDVLLKRIVNSNGELVREVYGDTLVNRTINIEGTYYSKIESFRIPLFVQYQFQWNKLSILPTLGLSANFISSSRGSYIDENLNRIELPVESKVALDVMSGLALDYHIKNGYFVSLAVNAHVFSTNWYSQDNKSKFKPQSFHLQLGIGRRF